MIFDNWTQIFNNPTLKIARRTIGAKGCKSDKAIIRFQKLERRLNEIRIQF